MMDDRKIWVIEDKEKPLVTNLGESVGDRQPTRVAEPAAPRRHKPLPAHRPAVAATKQVARPVPARPRPPAPVVHSAILLVAAYVLGPLGLVLTARGRRSGFWTAFAAGTAVLATVLGAAWWAVATRGESAALLPLLTVGTVVCVLAAFTVWARSLDLLFTSQRFPAKPWPAWVKNPWLVGPLGLVAPGVAWVFARRMRRAVVTAWAAWPLGVAILMLVQAPLIWRHREVFWSFGINADALEYLFIAAGVATLATPLIWIGQALLGARQTAHMTDRWRPHRGDWSAVALAVALVAMVVAVQPGDLAADLGGSAGLLRDDGLRVLPLQLTSLARHLDPGQPAYALQLAELHAERGDAETAERLRRDLDRSLQPYVGALVREGRLPQPPKKLISETPTTLARIETPAPVTRTRGTVPPGVSKSPPPDLKHVYASAGFLAHGLPVISDAMDSPAPVRSVRESTRPVIRPEPEEASAETADAGGVEPPPEVDDPVANTPF